MIPARPILFSAPMIRALLDGRKTQTRRIAKPQFVDFKLQEFFNISKCPYGKPGDLLWVRETWQFADWTEDGQPHIGYEADNSKDLVEDFPDEWVERLMEIWAGLSSEKNYSIDNRASDRRWRPSIHMPRWTSRLTLRITDVRVQRLQEISEEDARSEGCRDFTLEAAGGVAISATEWFSGLWNSINGAGAWEANPWVWALTFEVIKANVDNVSRIKAAA